VFVPCYLNIFGKALSNNNFIKNTHPPTNPMVVNASCLAGKNIAKSIMIIEEIHIILLNKFNFFFLFFIVILSKFN